MSIDPTPTTVMEKVIESIGAVQQAQQDIVRATQELAGHTTSPDAHAIANITGLQAALADKAGNSMSVPASIGTTWAGSAAPYTQSIAIAGVTAQSVVEVILPDTATQAHVEQYQALNWTDGGQAEGSITLKAWGTPNTSEIPVTAIVRG